MRDRFVLPVVVVVVLAAGCGGRSSRAAPSRAVGGAVVRMPGSRPLARSASERASITHPPGALVAIGPPSTAPTAPDDSDTPRVDAGTCDVAYLPAGTRVELPDEQSREVRDLVRGWLGGRTAPVFDARRGIVYAKSEDDRGDDPPYPSDAGELAERACARHASWLRSHVHARLAMDGSVYGTGVTCDRNVCCSSGMEYVPSTVLVLRPRVLGGERLWVLDTYAEVAGAALSDELVARNRRFVGRALARLARGACRGEPEGLR